MQNNFPGFEYESLQRGTPIVKNEKMISLKTQQHIQTNFLLFDWEKFSKPQKQNNKKSSHNETQQGLSVHNDYLAKIFDCL